MSRGGTGLVGKAPACSAPAWALWCPAQPVPCPLGERRPSWPHAPPSLCQLRPQRYPAGAAGTRHGAAALCGHADPSRTCSRLSPRHPNLWVLLCHAGGLAEAQGPGVPVLQPPHRAPRSRLPGGSSRFMFAEFCLVKP